MTEHPTSISGLEQSFYRESPQPALVDARSGTSVSFSELHRLASSAGAHLRSQGIARGERLAILLDNSPSVAILYVGALYAGVSVVPINPMLSPGQIGFVLRDSGAKAVFTSASLRAKVEAAVPIVTVRTRPELAERDAEDVDLFSLPADATFTPYAGASDSDELIVVYTSGTTAEPKGVVHTLGSLFGNGRMFVDAVGIAPGSRFLNILPMTYLGGYYNLLMIPYVAKSSVVIAPAFNAESALSFWKTVEHHQVDTLWVVPTLMSILLEIDRGADGESYSRRFIKTVLVGTAPLPDDLRTRFETRYGVRVFENFALSETLFLTSNTPGDGSTGTGRILPGIELKVCDEERTVTDREGEIHVRTPYRMRGYLGASEESSGFSRDGWFATGDLGVLTASGDLFVTGRKKDLIIRGGINISPSAIEAVLLGHPDVARCAVVGMPHHILGEEVVAVVQARSDDFDRITNELSSLCRTNLASVQCPARFVPLREFPLTFSGKIQKAKIRAWLKQRRTEVASPADAGTVAFETPGTVPDSYFKASRVVAGSIEAMSIRYNNLVYDLQRAGEDVIVLSLGEAFFDIPLFDFSDLPFPAIYHYSHSRGIPELRHKLAAYFRRHYEVQFDAESEILVTAGSKIAIYMALLATLNPGDEALIYEPAWVSYVEQVRLCHGVPVSIPHHENVYDFEKYITNRTRLIIINSPNNPTGRVYTLEELAHLHLLARKYNLYVLSDEAYSDFLLQEDQFVSMANLDGQKRHTIVVNSISKNHGISGWRLGYVVSNAEMIDQLLKVNQHLVTCPPTILSYYIAQHFNELIEITKPQIVDVVKRRQAMAREMDELGLRYLPGTATFYFFVSIEGTALSSVDFCTKLLEESRVSVVPGVGYGQSCDRFVRVSVGTESPERIRKGLALLKDMIEKTRASSQLATSSFR